MGSVESLRREPLSEKQENAISEGISSMSMMMQHLPFFHQLIERLWLATISIVFFLFELLYLHHAIDDVFDPFPAWRLPII